MAWDISNLPWLTKPGFDYRTQCQGLKSLEISGLAERLVKLANCSFNLNQSLQLARQTDRLLSNDPGFQGDLRPFQLSLVCDGTTDFLVPALKATCLRYGILLDVVCGQFGQTLQEVVDPESKIYEGSPDAILVAISHHGFPVDRLNIGDRTETGNPAIQFIDSIIANIQSNADFPTIVQNIPFPPDSVFGNFDVVAPETRRNVFAHLNSHLAETISASSNYILDIARLGADVGLLEWHNDRQWNMAKLPFSQKYTMLYADHVARIIGAISGRSKKCLVLDLDNTVWGGVIGDDGVEGILLGNGDTIGEGFIAVQKIARDLKNRGVMLAVCSKNEDSTARIPFLQHPDMILKLDDIAVFQANWNDKASNLEVIAETLNIGLDSLVFLDDNPAERHQVRLTLPMVSVPEISDDPALTCQILNSGGYFESVNFTHDDKSRASQYKDNANRNTLQATSRNLDDYLTSLGMEISFAPFDQIGRSRITQLVNKSNQFNLTTRRYTEFEIQAFEEAPDYFSLQVRLSDVFGDNGMISVIICRQDEKKAEWHIDTWLMSCRVLKRQVEDSVLKILVEQAHNRKILRITGQYIPTGRNELVKDHYSKLGFKLIETSDDGSSYWSLSIDEYTAPSIPMKVVSGNFKQI
jgi:FkbH-like protein